MAGINSPGGPHSAGDQIFRDRSGGILPKYFYDLDSQRRILSHSWTPSKGYQWVVQVLLTTVAKDFNYSGV